LKDTRIGDGDRAELANEEQKSMGPTMHDLQPSTKWAIANVESKGVLFMSGTIFDLVNLNSGRAHRLRVSSAGVSQGLGKYFAKANLPFSYSPKSSMSNYGYFSTYRHVNFDDFDGVGARMIGASVALWAWCSLTLWDGPAYISRGLAFARTSGWGLSTPAVSLDHGVAEIVYDDGVPLGLPDPLPIEISDPPTPTRLHKSVQIVSSDDEFVVILGGDTLFDFDKSQIGEDASTAIAQSAAVIGTWLRAKSTVLINGYTDNVGTDAYNVAFSKRRAEAAADWLSSHHYLPASMIQTQGTGNTKPLRSNSDAAGRAQNRRIEIL
jgi:outer membrane protein OmpA-like peptidoglycan-associated protein